MDRWIYVVLSSIILLVLFPFKITGIICFTSRNLTLKVSIFLFTFNVISMSYVVIDQKILVKQKAGEPKPFDIRVGKRGATRAKVALLPEYIKLKMCISGEENIYMYAGAVNVLASYIERYLSGKGIGFDALVYPYCMPTSAVILAKCVFKTSLLRIFSSFISSCVEEIKTA